MAVAEVVRVRYDGDISRSRQQPLFLSTVNAVGRTAVDGERRWRYDKN